MTEVSLSSNNKPSTSTAANAKRKFEDISPIGLATPSPTTPLIKRCRPMTDEWLLKAPSKERVPRRSESYISTIGSETPRRRSDFHYRSKPLFANNIKE